MPIKPNSYKLVCPKCGFSKVVALKSDCLSPKDLMNMSPICSKCQSQMDKKDLNKLDTFFSIFK
jgi:hypothetical protein